jgi:hypothetical protein
MFLDTILTQCSKFSDDIVVSYGSHLYDGRPEDMDHITEYKSKYPSVQFVCYQVDISLPFSQRKGVVSRPTAYWHNMARWTAIKHLRKHEWVFVLDCDEIPEGDAVRDWLGTVGHLLTSSECYKIANYWYFKDPTNRAKTIEDSVLLIHYSHLTEDNVFHDYERDDLIRYSRCKLKRRIVGIGRKILFHHFSWTRDRKGLEHKIKNWAHANDIFKDANVEEIMNYIYKDDGVNDIVHKYEYEKVENKFGLVI